MIVNVLTLPSDNSQVEAIVGHKKEKGKTLYRVHWKGYPNSDDSWLASADITCKDLLKRYKKRVEKETKDVYVVSWKIADHYRIYSFPPQRFQKSLTIAD